MEKEDQMIPQEEKTSREEKKTTFAELDREVFRKKYPDVDLPRLMKNRSFLRFCGSRLGNTPLVRLYEDYVSLLEEIGETERKKCRREDKEQRSTASGCHSCGDGLTAREQKALDEWNKTFPQLKMTAREFLARKD